MIKLYFLWTQKISQSEKHMSPKSNLNCVALSHAIKVKPDTFFSSDNLESKNTRESKSRILSQHTKPDTHKCVSEYIKLNLERCHLFYAEETNMENFNQNTDKHHCSALPLFGV